MAQGPTQDKSTLAQVMAWCNKPLPEPVLTQIYGVTRLSNNELVQMFLLVSQLCIYGCMLYTVTCGTY